MSRILFAWEQGGSFGHVSRQLPVARHLRRRGHDVLFAAKDVGIAHQLLEKDAFRYVQSPNFNGLGKQRREAVSFADILVEAGFGEPDVLHGLVRSWQSLFEVYRPEVIVGQYAPVALIAAYLIGLPSVGINTGFECPPDVTPFPCFRPWLKVRQEELLAREELILKHINALCAEYGVPLFSRLPKALQADISLLVTLPEIDHYFPAPGGGRYIGPLFVLDDGVDIPWPEMKAPRIIAYLRPIPELQAVLEALAGSNASVIACIPGIKEQQRHTFTSAGLRIEVAPVKLANLLPRADLTVTNGGQGLVSASLLAGVPMLTIPTNIEQWMTARNLERLELGICVPRDCVATGFAPALTRLLSEETYRHKARKFAEKYAGYDQDCMTERLANTIERLPRQIKNDMRPEKHMGWTYESYE